jgi:hypothetical protein
MLSGIGRISEEVAAFRDPPIPSDNEQLRKLESKSAIFDSHFTAGRYNQAPFSFFYLIKFLSIN